MVNVAEIQKKIAVFGRGKQESRKGEAEQIAMPLMYVLLRSLVRLSSMHHVRFPKIIYPQES